MNLEAVKYLVSPTTQSKLHLVKPRTSNSRVISGRLVSEDRQEVFPIRINLRVEAVVGKEGKFF